MEKQSIECDFKELENNLINMGLPKVQMKSKTAKNIVSLIAADNGVALDLLKIHIEDMDDKVSKAQKKYDSIVSEIDKTREQFDEIIRKVNIISSFEKSISDELALNAIKMYYAILDSYKTDDEDDYCYGSKYSNDYHSLDSTIKAASLITSAYLCGKSTGVDVQKPSEIQQVSFYD